MKFIVLLVVLGLRRLDLHWPHWLRANNRFEACLGGLSQPNAKPLLAWLLTVLLPAVVIAAVLYGLDSLLWGLPNWLLGGLLLLWLWGAQSEFRQLDNLLALGRRGNQQGVEAVAAEQFGVVAGDGFFKRVQQHFLMTDARVLFASIFWLILLGYWAVFLYLANRFFVTRLEASREHFARQLDAVLFYPVARLLVFCLALTSDFRVVMQVARGHWLKARGEALLWMVVSGLLASAPPAGGNKLQRETDHLEQLHAAMLRALALWLVVAAVWVMLVY